MTDGIDTWRTRKIYSYGFGTNILAVAPGCPIGPHGIRDCGCRAFRSYAQANEYIREQKAIAAREVESD